MNRLLTFFRFWRHFIIGDDQFIAMVIMWSLLFIWSLATNLINGWPLLPLFVVALLSRLFFAGITKRPSLARMSTLFLVFSTVIVPIILVTVLPMILFRFISGVPTVANTLVPASVYIVIALSVGTILERLYSTFPALCIFIGGLLSFLFVAYWEPAIILFSANLTKHYLFITDTASCIIVIFFVTCLFTLYRHRTDLSL